MPNFTGAGVWDSPKTRQFYKNVFKKSAQVNFTHSVIRRMTTDKQTKLHFSNNDKILNVYLFVLTESTNVTVRRIDTQTPHDGIGRACTALQI